MASVRVKNFSIGKGNPLTIISGPCAIESELHAMQAAETLKKMFQDRPLNFIYKSSYDKANRLSVGSFRGPGLDEGLRILAKVKQEFDVPVLTDIHEAADASAVAQVCDVVQIPAMLCRQTDLTLAVAKTGCVVNVKKGQFMAPWDMKNIVNKIRSVGNENIILTDRGTTFGYNNLVSDMRGIPIMQGLGVPVCFDATHSVQLPGGQGGVSGGQSEFIPVLSKAAIAAGADCLFIEAHPDPINAKSDASSVLDFKDLPKLLDVLERLYAAVNHE